MKNPFAFVSFTILVFVKYKVESDEFSGIKAVLCFYLTSAT